MGAIELLAVVAVELLATFLLIRGAAAIYERSILRTGAPIGLRSALAAGGARGRWRIHVPATVLQAIAVAGLVGGLIAGTDRPLGVVLIATGLLATVLYQYGRHRPRTPHG